MALALVVASPAARDNTLVVDWNILDASPTSEIVGGMVRYDANFPDRTRSLAGRKVRVAGYLMGLRGAGGIPLYFLMADPSACTQHMHADPGRFIELGPMPDLDRRTPEHPDQRVLVEGILELDDEGPSFFTLAQSRILKDESS